MEQSTQNASFEEVLEMLKKKDQGEIVLGFKRIDLQNRKEDFFRVPLKKAADCDE